MPGFMPGIHVFVLCCEQDVDGRDKVGHDDFHVVTSARDRPPGQAYSFTTAMSGASGCFMPTM